MSWQDGYSSQWRVYRVNPRTWADADVVPGFRDLSLSCEDSGLVQSGTMTFDAAVGSGITEGYYRIVLYSDQGGGMERYEVATFHCVSGSATTSHGSDQLSVEGRSVLYPASENRLEHGSYAPAGVDGTNYAAQMLSAVTVAPVASEEGFTLDQPVVFDLGSTVLDSARALLSYGGARLAIRGDGTVLVGKAPADPALVIDESNARMVMPGVRRDMDLGKVANRYVAVDGPNMAVAVNDDPSSPVSHASRGYWSDVYDKSPVRVNGETLDAYARRKLLEQSVVPVTFTYTREYDPAVTIGSVVRATMPSYGLEGDMTVTRQRMASGAGLTVEETAVMEVTAWQ